MKSPGPHCNDGQRFIIQSLFGHAKIFKLRYYQNYLSNSNQILHSDIDHQALFVGRPKLCPTNPRWRTAAIIKIEKPWYLHAKLLGRF